MEEFDIYSIAELNKRKIAEFKQIRHDLCQNEPHLIATTPEEADDILDIWEVGL